MIAIVRPLFARLRTREVMPTQVLERKATANDFASASKPRRVRASEIAREEFLNPTFSCREKVSPIFGSI